MKCEGAKAVTKRYRGANICRKRGGPARRIVPVDKCMAPEACCDLESWRFQFMTPMQQMRYLWPQTAIYESAHSPFPLLALLRKDTSFAAITEEAFGVKK